MAREVPQYISQLGLSSLPRVQGSNAQSQAIAGVSEQLQSAAQKIYQTDMEIEQIRAATELQTNLNRQYMEAPNDPASLQALQQGYKKGFISNIKNQELRAKFDVAFDQYAAPLLDKATANKMQIQRQDHEFALRTAIDTSIETGASYVDGIKHNVPEFVMNAERTLQGNAVAFNEMVNARYADGEPVFTPAQRASFLEQRTSRIRAKYANEVQKEVEFIQQAEKFGIEVPQEKVAQVSSHLRNLGKNDAAERVELFGKVQAYTSELSRKSFTDIEKAAADEKAKAEAGDMDAMHRYGAAVNLFESKAKTIKDNPWDWYTTKGVISEDSANIIEGDPESLQATLLRRRTDVQVIKDIEGESFKMPLLKPHEISAIETTINTAPPEKAGALLATLGQYLTPEEKKNVVSFVAKKNPEVAMVMSVPPTVATEAIAGSRAKGYISDDAMRTDIATVLEGITLDPSLGENTRKIISDVYRARAAVKGDTGNIVKPEILNGVIKDVLGDIEVVAPAAKESKIIIPSGLTANDVEDRLASITDDVLTKYNGELPIAADGYRATAADILSKGEFYTLSDGVYGIRFGSGILYNSNGLPYGVDIKSIPAEKAGARASRIRNIDRSLRGVPSANN